MNANLRKITVVSAVAGSLALAGCGKTQQTETLNKAGGMMYIQATPSDKSCLVSVSTSGTNSFGQLRPEDIITDLTEIRNIIADNQAAYRKRINDTCGSDKKIKVLVEQDLIELQRQ